MLTVEKAKTEEITLLDEMQEKSFETTRCYFIDGQMPKPPEDEKDEHSFKKYFTDLKYTVLTIRAGKDVVGGAVVKDCYDRVREMELFFIKADMIGSGMGTEALSLVENYFPDTKIWRLITPTQVMKNVVFYVNKCKYHIVRVDNFDKEANAGMYVFEKVM